VAAPAVAAAGGAAAKTAGKKLAMQQALKRIGGSRGGNNDDDKQKGCFKLVAGCLLLPVALLGSGFVLFIVILGAAASLLGLLPASACGPTGGASAGGSPTSATQLANARTIIGVAKARNIPMQGWVVALATAFQESGIQNLANSTVPESLTLPHQGVGSDGTSVGVFQQLANTGWGTVAQEMDVAHAAGAFFDALLKVPNWQSLPVTVAAQTVQVSAYPDAYAKWEGQARALASANTDAPPVNTSGPSFAGSSSGGSSSSSSDVCGGTGTYINPFKTGSWGPARTDQGVDWIPNVDEPVLAIGNGHITYASNHDCGWPGTSVSGSCGGCVVYELDDGPLKGNYIYVCEHITVTVMSGKITAGEQIATAYPGYAWTEWGWAASPGTAAAPLTPYGVLADGTPTLGGEAFARFLASLGAHPRDLSVAPTGPFIVGH